MALMPCPECGREISDAAISCPHCGLPRPLYEQQSRARRAAEEAAEEERRGTVRTLRLFAGASGLLALLFVGLALFTTWSRAALGLKLKELLLAGVFATITHLLWRLARRTEEAPHQ